MPKIDSEYPFGKEIYDEFPKLINSLGDMYGDIARAINKKPDITFQKKAPSDSDFRYPSGTLWIVNNTADTNFRNVYILTDKPSQETANWQLLN